MLDTITLRLESSQFDWLCLALRTISLKRVSILRIMTFCMDNCIYAEHIVCILRDSICDNVPYLGVYQKEYDCSPVTRIARLYVVNDLLYNADNGATTSYRILIQVPLPLAIRIERTPDHDRSFVSSGECLQVANREEGNQTSSKNRAYFWSRLRRC